MISRLKVNKLIHQAGLCSLYEMFVPLLLILNAVVDNDLVEYLQVIVLLNVSMLMD